MQAPRMSTRHWMVTVALLSLAFSGYREVRRLKRIRDEYLARAEREELIARHYRRPRGLGGNPARVVYHANRVGRFAAVASRPWLHDAHVALKPK